MKDGQETERAGNGLICDSSLLPMLQQLLLQADGGLVAVDTETSGLNFKNDRIIGISLGWRLGGALHTVYLPVGHAINLFESSHPLGAVRPVLQTLLDPSLQLVFHSAPFDTHFLGQIVPGWFPAEDRYYDVSVLARLSGKEAVKSVGARPILHLLDLYEQHLHKTRPIPILSLEQWRRQKSRRSSLATMLPGSVCDYARMDAGATLGLAEVFLPVFRADPTLMKVWETERRFVQLLTRIEDRGLLLNRERALLQRAEFEEKAQILAGELRDEGLADPGSPLLVSEFLYKERGIEPTRRTPSGKPSTDRKALEDLDGIPVVRKIIAWRQYAKAVSSWIDPFLEGVDGNGRLHPSFDPAGTVSARISCRNPNLQAVPMSDRDGLVYHSLAGIFRADEGAQLYSFDYKQADLRLATCYARENEMARALATSDPYSEMAKQLWGQATKEYRALAKRFSLATINAIGVDTAAERFGISRTQAEEALNLHRRTYRGFPKAGRYSENYYTTRGFVPLWTNRKLYYREGEETHLAFSRLVQGGVAEMVKHAMLSVDQLLAGRRSGMVLQIHDSIVVELYEEDKQLLPQIVATLEEALPLKLRQQTEPEVRMLVDTGVWS